MGWVSCMWRNHARRSSEERRATSFISIFLHNILCISVLIGLLTEGMHARSCPGHGQLDGLLRTRLAASHQGLSRQCGSISWFKPPITCPTPVVLLCTQEIIKKSWSELAQTGNGSRY